MLSRYYLWLLALSFGAIPLWASAQPSGSAEDLPAATAAQAGAAVTYLERNWNRHGLASRADVADLVITDVVTSRRSGRTSAYLRQGIGGIPVIDGQMTVSVDENGHVFHAAGQLTPDLPSRAVHSGSGVSPATAANTIASEAGFPAPEPFQVVEAGVGATQKTPLTDGGGHTYQPVTAELVYIVDDSGALRLAWDATVILHGDDGAWRGLVDASSGEVLRLTDVLVRDHFGEHIDPPLVFEREPSVSGILPRSSAQSITNTGECYQVFAWPLHDPFHADPAWPDDGRTWECDPFDSVASPGGWHDDDGDGTPDYTITRGNNVHAYADWTGTNPPDPDGGIDLHFDFPIDFAQEPEDYVDAAVTNLFYWNNLIHDVMVHYGFDEAHGNFQAHNYTGDGVGGDYVNAEAQDDNQNACNNANFTFTVDGQNPRMQMYLGCSHTPKMDGDLDNHVIVHEYGHGISTRITGGPGTICGLTSGEGMGEGWSDWYGLMLTQDETASDYGRNASIPVGAFLFHDNPPSNGGIRPAPYTTDFGVNDYTYGNTQSLGIPHGVGFAWATILWEVTWDLIGEYGFEQDITNAGALAGNTIMMNLVTKGLALQPCSPGFVDGRDAILEAIDVVYGDQPQAWRDDLTYLVWRGFSRRGLGYFADQGSSGSNADNVEDFTVPSNIEPDAVTDLAADTDGDFVTLTWTAPNDPDSDVFNYDIRYASNPILTETDWEDATVVSTAEDMVPLSPGEAEELRVSDLDFETTYHFVVRSDDGLNTSALSNSVEVATLAPPVASVPTDPIDVALPPQTEHTVEYTISNAGPATLRYALDFVDMADGLERVPVPKPAPDPKRRSDPSEQREPPARDGTEDTSPAGEPQFMDSGGPDTFGYRWVDSNEPNGPAYNWIDITETGTEVDLGSDDHVIVDLPFDFPYYENTFDWVAIQATGALSFSDVSLYYTNRQIPVEDAWNGILAAYWDDLTPGASGSVYYDTLDDGRFVVSWIEVTHFPETGSFTFQIILDEYGGIVYQYQEIDGGGTYDNSATVGIENLDGTDGLQVVYNAPYVEDGLAVQFANWLRVDVTSGELSAGEEQTHMLSFHSGNLSAGAFSTTMVVTTNEQGEALTQEYGVPITLTAQGVDTEEGPGFEGTHRFSAVAPNPVNGLARTTLEVAEAQDVRVELFDMRGRKVVTPFEGSLAARTAQEITFDGSSLAPGVYVLRITGETFTETQRVAVVR